MTPRTITNLVLGQLTTVLIGVLLTAIFLRFYTTDWPNEDLRRMPNFPRLARNYGLWLCLVPFAWVAASVYSVRTLDALPQVHRGYLVAGYMLWAALVVFFYYAVMIACPDGFITR